MLNTRAIFERKISKFETQSCVIDGIELMDGDEFKDFSNNLLRDIKFIEDRKDEMYIDSAGKIHGLLAINNDSGDGILIDSQGYDYARYSAFMPKIKPYIEKQISLVADQIIKEATENTSNGSWAMYFEEMEENYGLVVNENNGIGTMLLDELESREEIAEIELGEECFDMTLYLDYCNNLDETESSQNMKM